jgi:serine/threonine protein kinase
MIDRTGEQIGNYSLVKLLGSGGFAQVYLGRHVYLDSPAAIKLLYMNLVQEEWEHFRAEARTLARLAHPHIIRLLDFGLDHQTPYLVMDYAPNGTIRQRVQVGERLPLATVVEYTNQLASALQYAHNEKVIHRDIKPENMLLGRNDELLLTDFGIAVGVHSTGTQLTQETGGTIAYMAPEQIQGHPRPASDQYSLAVVVYEWLTGKRPFSGIFTELAFKQLTLPPPPLHETISDVPLEVEQVVLTALAKDPKQRFGNVQAFAMALEHAVKAVLASAKQETIPPFHPLEQPIVLASSGPTAPPISSRNDSVRPPAGSPAPQSTALATALTTPATSRGRELAPGEQVQTPGLMTPQRLPQLPVTPHPVRREPASTRGLSRRAFLVGGLVTAGVVVAGGTTLLALHNHSTSTASGQTAGTTTTRPTATYPAAVPTPLAQDTFHRLDQQFWGTASDGHPWEQDAATLPDFSIAGQSGQIYRTAQGLSFYTAILGPIITNAEVIVRGSLSQFNGSHIGAVLRWTDNNHYYKAYIDGNRLNILKRSSPRSNPVLASVPFPAQANTSYTLRFRVIGATLQAKAWQTGSTEPANWMVSTTDTLFTSGLGGLRPQLAQHTTLQVTSFRLTAATGS